MKNCLIKLKAQLAEFDTTNVVDAAETYRSRGAEDKAANIAAIEDHLRMLHRERRNLEQQIATQWRDMDPASYGAAREVAGPTKPYEPKVSTDAKAWDFETTFPDPRPQMENLARGGRASMFSDTYTGEDMTEDELADAVREAHLETGYSIQSNLADIAAIDEMLRTGKDAKGKPIKKSKLEQLPGERERLANSIDDTIGAYADEFGTEAADAWRKAQGIDDVLAGGKMEPPTVAQPIAQYGKQTLLEIPAAQGRANFALVAPDGQLDLFSTAPVSEGGEARALYSSIVEPAKVGEVRVGFERIDSPAKAAHVFAALRKSPRERFNALVVDKNDKPLAYLDLFAGTVTQTAAYPAIVNAAVYQTPGAAGVWLSHNHPSGDPNPSAADHFLTKQMSANFGPGLGVEYKGHVVIAGTRFSDLEGIAHDEPIPAGARALSVPIIERRVRRSGRLDSTTLSSPTAARDAAKAIAGDTPGLVVLDAQNRPIGFYPMTIESATGPLRNKMGFPALTRALARMGSPSAAIYYSPKETLKTGERTLDNLGNALRANDVNLLDAIMPNEEGDGHVSFAERGFELGTGGPWFSRAAAKGPSTSSAAFKKWFGASKVVDGEGKPLVVYHGTVTDFSAFDTSRANVESDWGKGIYFTNTRADVAANYAGTGPDMTNRIDERAERLEAEYSYDDGVTRDVDERAREMGLDPGPDGGKLTNADLGRVTQAMARSELVEHEGATMPVYLAIKKPFVLGGDNETRLGRGALTRFLDALEQVASRFEDVGDMAELRSAIEERAGYDSISAGQLNAILRGDVGGGRRTPFGGKYTENALTYATNEYGKIAGHEIIRQAIERAGFDGIIDHVVDEKFGSQVRIGKPMAGMHPETVHYIAFRPEQVKSAIGNRGTFDRNNADILFDRGPVWYSELARQVAGVKTESAPPDQWKATLRNLKGVKSEEIEWSGVLDWLAMQKGKVTKAQVEEFLANNGVKVTETELSDHNPATVDFYFGDWQDTEPSEETIDDLAKIQLDEEINNIAREEGIAASEVDEDEAMDRAREWARRTEAASDYRERTKDVTVQLEAARGESEERTFTASWDGETFHLWDKDSGQGIASRAHVMDEPEIESAIRSYLADRGELGQGDEREAAKFESYTLPGGENYRELLLTLPPRPDTAEKLAGRKAIFDRYAPQIADAHRRLLNAATDEERREAARDREMLQDNRDIEAATKFGEMQEDVRFRSSHFDQPNILAHVRFDERTDAEGKRILFVEEIQSDWAQKGKREGFVTPEVAARRGYTPSNVPAAPFVGKTEAWVALAVKRMIRYAAENGFDRIAWTTGEQQADRYDLSHYVDRVLVRKLSGEDSYHIGVWRRGNESASPNVSRDVFNRSDLADLVGKDLADKIINDDAEIAEVTKRRGSYPYHDVDLKIGGEGMRGFYDKIVPNVVNDVLKKLGGGKVGEVALTDIGEKPNYGGVGRVVSRDGKPVVSPQPGFDITPAMREKAMEGLPLFRRQSESAGGLTVADARKALVDAFGEKAVAKLESFLTITQSERDWPLELQSYMQGGERGVYYNGKAWIAAGNLRSAEEAVGAALHEIGEHHGLKDMLGGDRYVKLQGRIRSLFQTNDPVVRRAWADVVKTEPALKPGSTRFVTEVLARVAQDQEVQKASWWRELLDAIRAWLTKTFGIENASPADIQNLALVSLRRAADQARAGPGIALAPAFHKGEQLPLALEGGEAGPAAIEWRREDRFGSGHADHHLYVGGKYAGSAMWVGHPTAHYPYYIEGPAVGDRGLVRGETVFPRSSEAKQALLAMAVANPNFSRATREEGIPPNAQVLAVARSTDALKAHPQYEAAKAGDPRAAEKLVRSLVGAKELQAAREAFGKGAIYTYPHAEEASGRNAIPALLAARLASATGGTVEDDIIQGTRAFHTGAPAMQRLIARPVFDGKVQRGARYVLVDDVTTMGGTLAELADHIRAGGGKVAGVMVLADMSRGGKLTPPEPSHVRLIKQRFGHEIRSLLNVEPAALTGPEARYIAGFRDADSLRARVASAKQERAERLRAKGLRPDEGVEPQFSRRAAEELPGMPAPTGAPPRRTTPLNLEGGESGNRATWDAPEPSKIDDLIYALQNKHIDTKRILEAVRREGREIADRWNPYLQEELYHGRTAKLTEEFVEKELKPLLVDMAARDVSMEAFEEYLWMRHAKERNEQIARVNPDMPDGGSGATNAEADEYFATLDEPSRVAFEALARKVDTITAGTRRALVEYHLESPSTVQTWERTYTHYVPLMREEMDHASGLGIGQGFSVRGSSSKRATGSSKGVIDILANIALQRERAIVRGEKNRVALALYGLAKMNPNSDFWKVDTPPTIKDVSKQTGLVEERVDPLYKSRDNVVMARIRNPRNGEIQELSVVFNERDPRAMRMAAALKNLDADELGHVLGASAKVTRYFASINTQYNPVFGVVNLTRDVQTALLNIANTPIAHRRKDVLANTISALRGVYIDLRDHRAGVEPTSTWASLFEEFQREGGQTGYRDMFRSSKERADAIRDEIAKMSEGKMKGVGRAVFDWLSDYNTAGENAVRLAAYKVAKEQGLTNQQAASLAKNLTVNFNRKGQLALQAGALYAFFNASAQGTARVAETLAGPAGRRIITGGLILGAIQALALAAAGFDDDEPPQFVREKSLVIPIGDKRYVSIPMPQGFNVIPNISRVAMEYALSGFKNGSKRLAALAGVFADSLNPIGSSSTLLQTVTPTVLDPLAAIAENKDWTGKPIARLDTNALAPTPGFTRAKDTASWWAKSAAEAVNLLSGGSKYSPGVVSPTPDQIDYLIGQVTGGLGRELSKAAQTTESLATGTELPTYKIPLVGRLYGSAEGQAPQASKFYENIRELNIHEAEIKGRAKDHQDIGEYLRENPEARLYQLANATERTVSKLRSQRRDAEDKGQRDRVKVLETQITNQMRRFNEAVERARKGEAAAAAPQ